MKKETCKSDTKMMGWKCSRPAIIEGYCKLHYDIKLREEGAIKAREEIIKKIKELSAVDKSSR